MTWNDDELGRIGGAEELQVSSVRPAIVGSVTGAGTPTLRLLPR
ncbi:hypothetical protein ACQP2X_17120 [Actinoplanes sp. CA-131856]